MSLDIKPLGKRVVVKPNEVEEKTISGIYIPDTAVERPTIGTVLKVGEVEDVKEGDTVLYGQFAGTEIEYKGEKYLLMLESDIYAIANEH